MIVVPLSTRLTTERLVLRAPRFEDAGKIAMLANERRIAENTARIPHPYALADAEAFLAAANRSDQETTFVIALAPSIAVVTTYSRWPCSW